jgi:hypothetical protein
LQLRYPVEEFLCGDRWFLGELRIGPEPLQDVRHVPGPEVVLDLLQSPRHMGAQLALETVYGSVARLLNRPKRKRLSSFKAGISVVIKVMLTVVAETGERFVFSEPQGEE